MAKWKRDFISAWALVVFSVVLFVYTCISQTTDANALFLSRSDTFCKLWSVVLGALGVLLALESLHKRKQEKGREKAGKIFGKTTIFAIAVLVIYLLVMDYIGFILSTIVFLIASIAAFSIDPEKKMGKTELLKKLALWIVISVAVSVACYYLFNGVLGVSLPTLL